MLRRLVLHPLLFAAYPVLYLAAQNLNEQVTFGTAAVTLGTVIIATGSALLVLWPLLRSAGRAGLLVSLYVVLFFSFGYIADAFPKSEEALTIMWGVIAALGTLLIVRMKGDVPIATMSLNVMSIALVLMNLVPIVTYEFQRQPDTALAGSHEELPTPGQVRDEDKRDIYYLIFDRYAHERVLREMYDFDNSAFLESLEERGFYIANSVANHQKTAHSVAASLNMTYLNYLEERYPNSPDYGPVYRLLHSFKVGAFLRSLGYTHYHLGSWWKATAEVPTADVNYVYEKALSEFDAVLLDTTWWPALVDAVEARDKWMMERERVKFQFAKVAQIARDPDPTFTFAHFLLPHPPYVFNQDGSAATKRDLANRTFNESFIEQTIYANGEITKLVDKLLEGPDEEDPIIVIQSDEGPHPPRFRSEKDAFDWWTATDAELREKLLILNAYYLPGRHDDALYRTISPVNTFRVIFNEYFGTNLPLLKDRTFIWKDLKHLYNFKDVTDRLYEHNRASRRP